MIKNRSRNVVDDDCDIAVLEKSEYDFLYEEALHNLLKDMTLDEFVRLLTNEFDELMEYKALLEGKKTCQRTATLFNPQRLDTQTKNNRRSIYEALIDRKFAVGLARVLRWNSDRPKVVLWRSLAQGINGTAWVSTFPPYKARDILRQYGIGLNSKLLDPCAGWGNRFVGYSVVVNHLTCFEPCIDTFNGLWKLTKFIQQLRPDFKPNIINLPFEESNLETESFDFAMCSPPYYDTELYSEEETNSCNRYTTFDDWIDGFFRPFIEKTMNALKSEAKFILNIGCRLYPIDECLYDYFSQVYNIKRIKDYLDTGRSLSRKEKGEMFFEISKK